MAELQNMGRVKDAKKQIVKSIMCLKEITGHQAHLYALNAQKR
jgi:hypothetical protein